MSTQSNAARLDEVSDDTAQAFEVLPLPGGMVRKLSALTSGSR